MHGRTEKNKKKSLDTNEYQKATKQVAKRICQKAKEMICEENETMLARANSQIGSLKRYNSRKLILQYAELL